MTRIILVRHGETPWNVEGRYQGQEDIPLSERGLEQAHLLAEGLRDVRIDRVIASPLKRAFVTGKTCADLHGLAVSVDERLTEINHGSWEGCFAQDIQAKYPNAFALWHTKPHLVQMPDGGECLEDVRKRAMDAVSDIIRNYPNETVLVAAHDAVNRAILCEVLGMDMAHFWKMKQDNTCINVIEYDQGEWRLVLLNSTYHLGYLFSGIEQAGL